MSGIIGEGEIGRFFEAAIAVPSQSADGHWQIELDGRVVKTPLGHPFVVSSSALAAGIAEEWNAQGDKIVPATMPLASLSNAAIDKINPESAHIIEQLVGYARSDLLCYWAEAPADLVQRQRDEWQPVLEWSETALGARFISTTGIIPVEQPAPALDTVAQILGEASSFHLTAVVDLAGRMNSVLLALAVWKRHLTAEKAFNSAYLDDIFQEEQWGADEEAVDRRSNIRNEISHAAEFLRLLDEG